MRLKSPTVTVTLTLWVKPPRSVPVTVTVYAPSAVVGEVGRFRVAVPDPPEAKITLDGTMDGVNPGDEMVAERAMLPENPFWLERVTATDPEVPRCTGKDRGLAETVKSFADPTVKLIVVE